MAVFLYVLKHVVYKMFFYLLIYIFLKIHIVLMKTQSSKFSSYMYCKMQINVKSANYAFMTFDL